ncbi:glutamate-1-semialdehyde aminotransferase [Anopheles sinensis]|uniref:Glutamate-1-semialdehyde aminotransferase n=1 Tax=Anopheles sinensis TaxID=74873 RepID=A0A084WJE0_ANOSI|nr:glutamate-1-semialdehyde aminotransferase [Anopheles sinensis]
MRYDAVEGGEMLLRKSVTGIDYLRAALADLVDAPGWDFRPPGMKLFDGPKDHKWDEVRGLCLVNW